MAENGQRIRVLIADDVLLVRRLLARDLMREPDLEVVGEAADGREAVELTRRLRPDVVLMDLEMPNLNGIQAIEQLRSEHSAARFVLLTTHEQLTHLGALAGAALSLDKSCTPETLAAAIRQAHDFTHTPEENVQELGPALARVALWVRLSDRERRVVEKVVCKDLTAVQIAHALGRDSGQPVSESSVKHALERAMNKIGVEPRTRVTLVKRILEICRAE